MCFAVFGFCLFGSCVLCWFVLVSLVFDMFCHSYFFCSPRTTGLDFLVVWSFWVLVLRIFPFSLTTGLDLVLL